MNEPDAQDEAEMFDEESRGEDETVVTRDEWLVGFWREIHDGQTPVSQTDASVRRQPEARGIRPAMDHGVAHRLNMFLFNGSGRPRPCRIRHSSGP